MPDRASAPPELRGKQPRNPISSKQIEKVISRSVAVFGLVFAAQTVPWLLGQTDEAYPIWLWTVVPLLAGLLIVVNVASFAQRWVRPAHGTFAIVYLLVLASWPFAVLPGAAVFTGIHWLNYLITVATAMAAIAFTWPVATVYLFVAPLLYSIVRATPVGGGASWQLAVLEGMYALILGGAVLIIVQMLRYAAATVDQAQATALDRYGHAVRQHATEVERVHVDAIVHDSVLTTLLSAARAYTPEAKALAATMAGNAIGHLEDAALASPEDDATVRTSALAGRIVESASTFSERWEIRSGSLGTGSLPAAAAEALHSASVQAMVNSSQHAGDGDVVRWVAVRGLRPSGIEVVVADTGAGFDLSSIPRERLGVRVSIIERVASAGGRAVIQSSPGEGTIITIRWPAQPAVTPVVPDASDFLVADERESGARA
ncbi:signal transduction histidine kinase [Microbacteriaceae bacterium SG_E_30_P1]|uniref:Signal transduction histidine kinase n=1 Tax=Antiquaquibacter oligotrophicus TaxID=2880260 RepID=A0ABT6KRB2_9MICO|nr:ATP-binding protein [Antiquaquibacter oligotrophicus]MDH6181742.1 signal transduction histidine kinase [Antiquaquibacter oligotrophicus]UDF12577.1 histidine kinase [Antiquaquibacter oligotrophicus]